MATNAAIAACAKARADPNSAPKREEGGMLRVKPGQRTFTDPQDRGLFASLVAVVTLILFVGWPYWLLCLFVTACVVGNQMLWAFVIVLFSTAVWPVTPHWQGFLNLWVFTTWRQYFDFSLIFKSKLDVNKRYIICEFPHGVFPFSPLVAGTIADMVFPDIKVYSVVASSVLRVPVYRQIMSWFGGRPATKKNFKKLLGMGSCAVVAGGVAEMYMVDKHKERIKLLSRKGFIRMAVELGVEPIPVYHYGNSQLLFIIGKALEAVSRALRASLIVTYGRFGLPLPHRVPLMMVVGDPVPVKQLPRTDPGFNAEVDRVHAAFVASLQSLYNQYRGEYGWADRELSIE